MGRRGPLLAMVAMCLVVSACGTDEAAEPGTAASTSSTTVATTTTTVAPLAADVETEPPDVLSSPPLPRAVGTTSGHGGSTDEDGPETEEEMGDGDGDGDGDSDDSSVRPLTDLQVGDCADLPGIGSDTPSETTAILHPCDHPHDAEVFARPSLNDDPEAPHPGDEEVLATADRICLDAFEEYVGRPYVDASLEIVHLRPNEAAWVRGDRIVVCALVSLDGQPLLAPVGETA